jgi:hypothetical protein
VKKNPKRVRSEEGKKKDKESPRRKFSEKIQLTTKVCSQKSGPTKTIL